jgi:hypothetical protein
MECSSTFSLASALLGLPITEKLMRNNFQL